MPQDCTFFSDDAGFICPLEISRTQSISKQGFIIVLGRLENGGCLPDWYMEIVQMIASGDVVVVRARVSGNSQGCRQNGCEWYARGHGADRQKVRGDTHALVHWYTLRDGKVFDHWANRDDLGMLRQLGLLREVAAQ